MNGPDQLRQRVAFALSEIWVVSDLEVNNASAFPPLLRLFQNDAFGNYEALMKDVSLNPAMGRFLNMVNNYKANPAKGTAANENYAREIMQLFTIGLTQLNLNGTPVVDKNGNPVATFTQTDVTNLAKAFTGWTYPPMPGTVTKGTNPIYYLAPMVPLEIEHDVTAKQILGVSLPAGRSAEQDLTDALHIIFMQPTLPPFVSQQLIEHLVTSNPSPAYVARIAQVFEDNGSGVRGDLQAVIHAILTDPEARAGDTISDANRAHLWSHARAGSVRCESFARLRRNGYAAPATSRPRQQIWASSFFTLPAFSVTFRRNIEPAWVFSARSFRSTRPRPPRTARTRSTPPSTEASLTQEPPSTCRHSLRLHPIRPTRTICSEHINVLFFHEDMSSNLVNAIHQALAPLTAPPTRPKPRSTSPSRPASIRSFINGARLKIERYREMFSRRGFIKIGAASVGSLALRPFGLLPALAQSSSPDYRALVCVFLFGGNDSNNMIVPVDDTNYQAVSGDPRQSGALDVRPHQHRLCEDRQRALRVPCDLAGFRPRCSRIRSLRSRQTSAAWFSRPRERNTRAKPRPFHSTSSRTPTSNFNGRPPSHRPQLDRLGRPRRRYCRLSEHVQVSDLPLRCRKQPDGHRRRHAARRS